MRERVLRKGVTTGACAQAAAKACAIMLVKQRKVKSVEVELPNGEKKKFLLIEQRFDRDYAKCSVIKDAGDEDDVTDGIKICCEVRRTDVKGLTIKGGCGVGVVTKLGLAVPVGEYAINPVPRQIILRDVRSILPVDKEGFIVEITVPEGEKIARKTYNPRLGIKDGISIIGTTGIVEPKSQEAYKASLSLELNVAKANGHKTIFLVSGYIGEKLLKKQDIKESAIIKIGDYVGFMLEQCVEKDISKVVLVGHIGKLAKVAAGLFNTHSKFGDARLETIAAHAGSCGAASEIVCEILKLRSAEESIEVLRKNNLMLTFNKIAGRVVERANEYSSGKLKLVCVILSLSGEIIGAEPENLGESLLNHVSF